MISIINPSIRPHRVPRGFTLIETLVAIAILMISIAGPLVIASKALNAALYAKDQSAATFLAQEEMEIIKNIRDNNLFAGASWDNGGLSLCAGSGAKCDFVVINGGQSSICPSAGCQLYASGDGYDHDSTGSVTPFSRHFYLVPVGANEYQAVAVVSWYEGTIPNVVSVSSEFVNAAR